MVTGYRKEGYETMELTSKGEEHSGKVVLPVVGSGERSV